MKFVMEHERMEFSEALRFLADKAGIVLEKQDPKLLTLKNKVLDVLKESLRFYQFHLSRGAGAQKYLRSRGLRDETIGFFSLGFAPLGWQNLYLFLKKQGFDDNAIEQSGMAIRSHLTGSASSPQVNQTRLYDRFRSRVIFPIFDNNQRVIGFSGRILPASDQSQDTEAKYINTPETVVYQKGRVLYGFSHTQNEIRAKEQAVLVEGNLDVLMGWQEGLKNIVAVSGTGLTEFQLKNLARSCKKLVLSFDMDKAGEQATDRSIGIASQLGFELSILPLPSDKDLADYAKDFPEKVSELLAQSKNVMQYYFDNISNSLDLSLLENKKKALAYLLPRIKLLKNPVEQNEWLTRLSSQIKVPERMIFEEFEKTESLLEAGFDGDDLANDVGSGMFMKTRQERLAEKIIGLAVRFPELGQKMKDFCDYFPFRFKGLARFLSESQNVTDDLDSGKQLPSALAELGENGLGYFYLLGDYELSFLPEKFSPENEMERSLFELKKTALRAKIFEYNLAIKEAEQSGNIQRSDMLLKEMSLMLSELKNFED